MLKGPTCSCSLLKLCCPLRQTAITVPAAAGALAAWPMTKCSLNRTTLFQWTQAHTLRGAAGQHSQYCCKGSGFVRNNCYGC